MVVIKSFFAPPMSAKISSPIITTSSFLSPISCIAKLKKFFSGLPIKIDFFEVAYSSAATKGPRSRPILFSLLQYLFLCKAMIRASFSDTIWNASLSFSQLNFLYKSPIIMAAALCLSILNSLKSSLSCGFVNK